MGKCDKCDKTVSMPFSCKFCERSFCSDHRLPENHDCGGLRDYKDKSAKKGKVTYDAMREEKQAETVKIEERNVIDRVNTPDMGILNAIPINLTYAVLGVMFAVFMLEGTVDGFFQAFALFPDAVLQGEIWRIVSSMFLHGSLGHLLVNSIVLFSFGAELERLLGKKRFLTVLFTAGIASGIGFTLSGALFGMGPAVGISGALYGLVALLAVVRPDIRVLAFFFIPLKIRTAIGLFATMDIVNFIAHGFGVILPVIGGFASAGHLSGLAAGLVFGYLWKDQYRQRMPSQINPFQTPVRRI